MNRPLHVCLVEDDAIMGESLLERFELEGFACDWHTTADSAATGLAAKSYDVVISDVRLPDRGGDELFQAAQSTATRMPPWIFITGYGTIERAIALTKQGAADYITKPFDLDRFIEKLRLHLPPSGPQETSSLGLSPGMRRIQEVLPRLAAQSTSILITGQSGVGKEVVAREIHRLDAQRSAGPFVAVNCGGIPEGLLEAELFGYEKGAFTGAARQQRGLVEQANGGTLLLDEIGEMPGTMQVKLLRVLQERSVRRIGGQTSLPVSFRLICATHRDLRKLVEARQFREDLFYRINVVHLKVPALHDRPEDIIWFARMFLKDIAREAKGPPKFLSGAAEQALLAHLWPGNVRELRHAIERAYVLTPSALLDPNACFEEVSAEAEGGTSLRTLTSYLEDCERRYLLQELSRHDWQMTNTARAVGISRKNLWERLRRLNVQPPARERLEPTDER